MDVNIAPMEHLYIQSTHLEKHLGSAKRVQKVSISKYSLISIVLIVTKRYPYDFVCSSLSGQVRKIGNPETLLKEHF